MDSKKILKRQIVETLTYADLFDYPLRKKEIIKWLVRGVGNQATYSDRVRAYLDSVNGVVFKKNGFFFLAERQHLVALRKKRQKEALSKLERAKQIANILSIIPTVKLIGISGSLSMENTKSHDDIDFLVITRKNALWLTRFASVILLELAGARRRPDEKTVKNKICLNMFIEDSYLYLPNNYQNLYVAHEVCQLRVILNRNHTYERFIKENAWVKTYLPNALGLDTKILEYKDSKGKKAFNILLFQFLAIFEMLAKFIQILYMKLNNRRPRLRKGVLSFYPKDYDKRVLKLYQHRLRIYGAI